jgi:hypothetical protein
MAAPERFAKTSDSSCTAGAVHTWHKGPSDLHYIVVGAALLASAGIGLVVASQIVVILGYAG